MSENTLQSKFAKDLEKDRSSEHLFLSLDVLALNPASKTDRVSITQKLEKMTEYVATVSDPTVVARFNTYAEKINGYEIADKNQPSRGAKPGMNG